MPLLSALPLSRALRPYCTFVFAGLVAAPLLSAADHVTAGTITSQEVTQAPNALIEQYCYDCHDSTSKKGDLELENLDPKAAAAHPDVWEKVVRKLAHRQMPPLDEERPDDPAYNELITQLTTELDRAAAYAPNPGRTDTFRRLTRTEYQNAVRDLLALEVDATTLLPNDEPSHGFDNVTVGNLSPTLLDRYVSAAQKIARLAVGAPHKTPNGDTFRLQPDVTQEQHVEGLPIGTRGGGVFPYVFAQDGTYEIQVRLARDRNEQVEGLKKPHDVEVLVDGERVGLFTVKPPGSDHNAEGVDAHLKLRIPVPAGPHELGVTFIKNPTELLETERQPFIARFNMHRHPRTAPALYQVSITGPFDATGAGDTPSRRLIFGAASPAITSGVARVSDPLIGNSERAPNTDRVGHRPALLKAAYVSSSPTNPAAKNSPTDDEERARNILTPLLRRAYRRPVTEADLRKPMQFFREGRDESGSFDAGIESAVTAILVSPRFLIRVEEDPRDVAPGTVYRISDLELASRLSFFLWSSLPDDLLLNAAVRRDLHRPEILEQQVRRMLADPRSQSLVSNF
ncbi:MAG: DUF1587 domain-containing protein, partial [Opitutus sp.]